MSINHSRFQNGLGCIALSMSFLVLAGCESPRLSRRLQTLRGWSHEQQIDEVRTRGA